MKLRRSQFPQLLFAVSPCQTRTPLTFKLRTEQPLGRNSECCCNQWMISDQPSAELRCECLGLDPKIVGLGDGLKVRRNDVRHNRQAVSIIGIISAELASDLVIRLGHFYGHSRHLYREAVAFFGCGSFQTR